VLLDVVSDFVFERFQAEQVVDRRHRYALDMDPQFPLAVRLLSFHSFSNTLRFNWHERLEIFVAAGGRGRFRMGDRVLDFARGDVLVVDNLKLHGLVDCEGQQRRGVVINFLPELVCNAFSYPSDSIYLLPFYSRPAEMEPIVRASDKDSVEVLNALGKLASCYFGRSTNLLERQAGCKAHLLEALYHLARHFGIADTAVAYNGGRQRSLQFGRLYEHLRENFSEPITVSEAASMVGLSEFRFMKFFKKATGTTFVAYLNQLRLGQAHRLLLESSLSIADIAAAVGFSDQSYFDRRFRLLYKLTPRQVRAEAVSSK
jgi:AraC-like DNA-binding protein